MEDVGAGRELNLRKNRKQIPYETFLSQQASKNLFDNDLLDMQYKFWENEEDREERLKYTWLELQKRNTLGGVDKIGTEE